MTTKRYYTDQQAWRELQEFLPPRLRLDDETAPEEDFWDWNGHTIHLDRYRNQPGPRSCCSTASAPTGGR